MVKICIIHFNTPDMTECLIRSINKFTPDSAIYLFDNSNEKPFTYRQDNIVYIDNTKGQIINFSEWLKNIPGSMGSAGAHNKWASAKHCYTVQKCIEIINSPFILLDSDVLLKHDITEIVDDSVLYSGEWQKQPGKSTIRRVLPYCLYINTDLLKKYGVTFYKQDYCHGLNRGKAGDNYDTGAWFYMATEKLPHKDIKYSDYVVHYGKGSWKNRANSVKNFLEVNKKLWNGANVDSGILNRVEEKGDVSPVKANKNLHYIDKLPSNVKRIYQRKKLYNFIYG